MGWFLLRKFVELFRIYSLLIVSRNHSKHVFIAWPADKRSKVKNWSKGYLWWYQDFDRFRQVAIHYLCLIPTDLGQQNLVASASSPKVRRRSIPTNFAHSVLKSTSSTKRLISTGDISKVIVVKWWSMVIKKKKLRKAFLCNIKTSEDKTERNLNEGKFGIKPSFKKKKTKVLSTRLYRIYVSQIEKLISGIWLLKLKFRVFWRFILLFKKVLLALNDLPE